MPRTTTHQQFERHQLLRRAYGDAHSLFADLLAQDQWELFDFYKPQGDLTLQELKAHQAQMAREQPSLPQRAGKAFAQFEIRYRERGTKKQVAPKAAGARGRRKFSVRAVAHSEVDFDKLARALLSIAKDLADEDKKNDKAA